MATQVASIFAVPLVGGRRRKIISIASWTLAATTGVATQVDTDDPGFTLTRSAAGTYAVTFPQTPGRMSIDPEVLNTFDNAASISGARLSAKSPSAGTATLKIFAGNSGLAVDPGASDVVTLTLTFTMDIS